MEYILQQKGNIVISICGLFATKIVLRCIRMHRTFCLQHAFIQKYGTDQSVGKFGIIPRFAALLEDECFLEYRLEQIKTFGPNNGLYFPPYMFVIADAKLAQFMLGLPSAVIEKAGLTKEIFSSDKNGFYGNLLMEEGHKWKLNRKIISKMLHLDTLEKYIEPMDISAITFANKLSAKTGFVVCTV